MKTTRTQESPSKVRLAIEASADEVAPSVERAFRSLAESVKVPGFRKGKVPRQVLEARLGHDAIREATIGEAIPAVVGQAIKDESLTPIAPPRVEVSSYDFGGTLALEVTVEVRPEIRIPDLAALLATRPSWRATEQEIDDQIARLRDRFATLEDILRPAQPGDHVLIDLRGYHNDQTIDGATATDFLYEVGSGTVVPELDQELTGKRAGDILRFNATLPEAFPGEFAGKEVAFQVLVKETKQKLLPALDDEFARTSSEFDTLDQLREDLRKKISQVKRFQADLEVRARLVEQLVESVDLEPPESLVNEEMAYRGQRFAEQLRQAGMTFEAYLQSSGKTEEQVESELRAQAERNIRAQLILEDIGRSEEITVSKEEIAEELRGHAQELRVDPSELGKQLEGRGRLGALAGDIIRRKALNLVVERAEIRDEDPVEPEPGPEIGQDRPEGGDSAQES